MDWSLFATIVVLGGSLFGLRKVFDALLKETGEFLQAIATLHQQLRDAVQDEQVTKEEITALLDGSNALLKEGADVLVAGRGFWKAFIGIFRR